MRFSRSASTLGLAVLSVGLIGCEGALTLDILADAPAPQGQLTLAVDQIELVHSDGGVETFDVEQTLTIDSGGLTTTRLLSGETVRDGNYTGIRLRLQQDQSSYDPDVTDTVDALDLNLINNPAEANNQSFSVSEDEVTELSLKLGSFVSLSNTSDSGRNSQDFDPALELSRTADTRSVSFSLQGLSAFESVCASTVSGLPRLYIFSNFINQALDDVDGGANDPLRVLHAQPSTDDADTRSWRAPRLSSGTYRLALSCSDDDPAFNETVVFFCTSTQTLDSDTSVDLVANSTDASCPPES